ERVRALGQLGNPMLQETVSNNQPQWNRSPTSSCKLARLLDKRVKDCLHASFTILTTMPLYQRGSESRVTDNERSDKTESLKPLSTRYARRISSPRRSLRRVFGVRSGLVQTRRFRLTLSLYRLRDLRSPRLIIKPT